MASEAFDDVRLSYDRVADEYVRRIFDELGHKPLDRELLDRLAARLRGRGPICDLGCGPGHVARYLRERGAEVLGVDLSAEMVKRATELNPGIPFRQGDMLALEAGDEAWAGIAAFYSIIHVPHLLVPRAFAEFWRVLQPGGALLLAFHVGQQTIHLDEWWDQPVNVDFHFFQPQETAERLIAAGFTIEEITEREPYANVEHPSRRAYILASKSAQIRGQDAKRGSL